MIPLYKQNILKERALKIVANHTGEYSPKKLTKKIIESHVDNRLNIPDFETVDDVVKELIEYGEIEINTGLRRILGKRCF